MYRRCLYCNATLDPGEKCDCTRQSSTVPKEKLKAKIENILGYKINLAEFKEAKNYAIIKMFRNGISADNEKYLALLISDTINERRIMQEVNDVCFQNKKRPLLKSGQAKKYSYA